MTTYWGGLWPDAGGGPDYWGGLWPDAAGEADPEEVEPEFAGVGPEPAAVLALDLLAGSRVTYSWSTGVFKSFSGRERRTATRDFPAQRYQGSASLFGVDTLSARSALARHAARGSPFLLGLPFEEIVVADDAVGKVVPVFSTAMADWALPGQRVIVIADDEEGVDAVAGVVQVVEEDSLELDVEPGAIARAGARIMPGMVVLLDPQQGFARYPNQEDRVEQWQLAARAQLFGFAHGATKATLSLASPLTSGGGLEQVLLRARQAGSAGNAITVEFDDQFGELGAADLVEDVEAGTVMILFIRESTTVGEVAVLLADSQLIEMAGTWDDETELEATDEFAPTPLSGGEDETLQAPGRGTGLNTYLGHGLIAATGSFGLDEQFFIRALVAGPDGNLISVEMTPDAITSDGAYSEDGLAAHIQILSGETTAEQLRDLVNGESTLIEIVEGPDFDPDVLLVLGGGLGPSFLTGGAESTRIPVWDRGVDVDGQAGDSIQTMAEIIDMGGVPFSAGTADVPDWGRQVSMRRSEMEDWQWLKLLLHTIRGRQRVFWLPTHRADLEATGTISGETRIGLLEVDEQLGDLPAWWPAQRRHLVIETESTFVYVEILAADDHRGARLSLAPTVTNSGSLDEVVLIARAGGADGNSIEVRFVADADGPAGSLEEGGRLARLALSTVTSSGVLDGVTLFAREGGTGGNAITVEFDDDEAATLDEDAEAGTVKVLFVPGTTTVADLAALLADSELVEMLGDFVGSDELEAGDTFAATNLVGGTDELSYVVVHFEDGATVDSLADLISDESTLIQMAGTWAPDAPVIAGDDEFDPTLLSGGTDENPAGTIELTIRADPGDPEAELPLGDPIASLSWLEQCRLESDEVEVTWEGATFLMTTNARVVQQDED